MIELERTFLAKQIPDGLKQCKSKEILDIYIPKSMEGHAPVRLRKNGDVYEITKKSRVDEGDHTKLLEQTISLTRAEFMALEKEIVGKRLHKTRYYYPVNGRVAEVDVFMDALTGLVLIDFEFTNEEEMKAFKAPFFCLAEVGHEDFIRGGVLAGKRYSDLEVELVKHAYLKLFLK